MENKRYYKVTAKCGHVGRGKYIPIDFGVKAIDRKTAASRVRNYKRVKHHKKDAIEQVVEITFEEFMILRSECDNDPYLHCKNIQQQREFSEILKRVKCDNQQPIISKNRNTEYKKIKANIKLKDTKNQIKDYYMGAI